VLGLGLKRGLEDDLVIAPYASALAAMYAPSEAASNCERLASLGAMGRYGYYEALDFTPIRLPERERFALVRAYMAHHQGMTLVALDNALHEGSMRHRLHREPIIQAAELLLEERMPRTAPARDVEAESAHRQHTADPTPPQLRRIDLSSLTTPQAHWLSNGRYSVMLTAAGSGYSLCDAFAVTRWRDDPTRDCWGSYLYLRDEVSGKVWSPTYQPLAAEPDAYEANFFEDRARFVRRDGSIASVLEVIVSPEDPVEIRHLTISNNGSRVVDIEVTTYAEVVLAPGATDAAHPAFSKLFIETQYARDAKALLARRRPRSSEETELWAAHGVALPPEAAGTLEYETDRARFVGRGRAVRDPSAIADRRPLSNTVGAVLDPIFSLRCRVRVFPNASVSLAFTTMIGKSRMEVLDLADKYHDPVAFERVSAMAWTHAQVMLHYLRVEPDEAMLFQQLASRILFQEPASRLRGDGKHAQSRPMAHLWRLGISGDHPLVLVRIHSADDLELVHQLARAHEYWRTKRFAVDLVFINEQAVSYAPGLQSELADIVRASSARIGPGIGEQDGSLFVLRADHVAAEDRALVQAAARVVLAGGQGTLAEQVLRRTRARTPFPARRPAPVRLSDEDLQISVPRLEFPNGLGGFADAGREYAVVLTKGQHTPAPWVNVVANPQFGFLVSETGAASTWCINSRENLLTPWSNDPVSDASGEACYVRDDESGALWSPTAWPIRIAEATYLARHGQGYSRFETSVTGIRSELTQFVPWQDPFKLSQLRLVNTSARSRRLTITFYVEWALRAVGSARPPYIITERDPATDALFAQNPWSLECAERVAFADLSGRQTNWTCDRTEFLGRYGDIASPTSLLQNVLLSRRAGVNSDSCAVLQCSITLEAGVSAEIVFLLGQAESRDAARAIIENHRNTRAADVLAHTRDEWARTLEQIQIHTPERSIDLLVNRWLPYQTLACRFWARGAFYQAGGAYGFRDQLQDCMALALFVPDLARGHLLRAASRQFLQGDVQHWWHPPSGRGVRTRISDDRVWLAYAAAHYVAVTGDHHILDEQVSFIEGQALAPGQDDAYFEPGSASRQASLYEHCALALEASLASGSHGLPLIGSGDWNDGMNRVGHHGQGESIWLAWFLLASLGEFARIAQARDDAERAQSWRAHAAKLKTAVEAEGWDGAWYRRAFFDDGSPLGSAANAECRIDSIAQSWAVLSGAGEPDRMRRAMSAVDEYLVRPGDDLLVLLAPSFRETPQDPGYIKGYLPGVRENGGQYTHAAIWSLIAHTLLGNGDQAAQIFRMVNPILRASSRAGVHAYKVEPYVVAGDVYAEPPHARRGGWTWYTGAAGWLYRAAVEHILGVKVRAARIEFDPCVPRDWRSSTLRYRCGGAHYEIRIENPNAVMRGVVRLELDGELQSEHRVPLLHDGKLHRVTVWLG
jgi:cyclic beta-1,2-glucan synthetase